MATHTDICNAHSCRLCPTYLNVSGVVEVDYVHGFRGRVSDRIHNQVVLRALMSFIVK